MTAKPVHMADFAARVSRPPFWPAVEQPKPTADNPIPSRPGPNVTDAFPVRRDPALELRDTEIVGRLRFLLREIGHQAAEAHVPADLAGLIGQAQRIADGDTGLREVA